MKLPSAKVRNSRGGSPLICPPMMNEALKGRAAGQVRPVAPLDIAHGVGHEDRDIEHGARVPDVVGARPALAALLQHADHRLRARQVAGAQQHDDPIARALEHVILQNVAKLSTPACVRESDASTTPSRRSTPTQ